MVMDPFCGGGTVLVEALAGRRSALGTDINPLAVFIARAKTTILSQNDISEIIDWGEKIPETINMRTRSPASGDVDLDFLKHLQSPKTWRIVKAINQTLESITSLKSERSRGFARIVILRTGQWAIDGRRMTPSISAFRDQIQKHLAEMIRSAKEFKDAVGVPNATPGRKGDLSARIYRISASQLDNNGLIKRSIPPDLIITSPPYPGVHVLYNRWQVMGRRETQFPQLIAGISDKYSSSYFTFGSRQTHTRQEYFTNLFSCFRSIRKVVQDSTIVCQVIGYSNSDTQLPRYLSVLQEAGFKELKLLSSSVSIDGRMRRIIPNRKWYNRTRMDLSPRSEIVLFHTPI
jgi:hypothetical protein